MGGGDKNKKRHHTAGRTKRKTLLSPDEGGEEEGLPLPSTVPFKDPFVGEIMRKKSIKDGSSGSGGACGSGTSNASGGSKKIKRPLTKERWLLTRKTWKYMTDAGRRLIPIDLNQKMIDSPGDISKIEEFFQDVCHNEPRFLIWRRKCSYPGAMGTSSSGGVDMSLSSRRKLRNKNLFSSLTNTAGAFGGMSGSNSSIGKIPGNIRSSSADEFDENDDDAVGGNRGVSAADAAAQDYQREQLIINMLQKYLNIKDDEFAPHHVSQNSLIDGAHDGNTVPSSKFGHFELKQIKSMDDGNTKSATVPSPSNVRKSAPPTYTIWNPSSTAKLTSYTYPIGTTQPTTASDVAGMANLSSAAGKQKPFRYLPSTTSSLLLDNLRQYSQRKSSLPPLSNIRDRKITSDILNDKVVLRRIYDELKQHQIRRMLQQTSRSAYSRHMPPTSLSSPADAGSATNSMTSVVNSSGQQSQHQHHEKQQQHHHIDGKELSQQQHEDKLQKIPKKQHEPHLHHNIPLVAIKAASLEKCFINHGIQTDPIPETQLTELLKIYKKKCDEEAAQRQEDESHDDTAGTLMHGGDQSHKQTTRHGSRRKSSIDNEDVSQSVSDTIKRYLRMARKKSVNDTEQANRFKRINYDRALRNIKPKGEITMPGDDEDNSKGCQTNPEWISTARSEFEAIHYTDQHLADEQSPVENYQQKSIHQRPTSLPTSSATAIPSSSQSSPSSPSPTSVGGASGLFHSGTQFLTNLLWHNTSSGSSGNIGNNNVCPNPGNSAIAAMMQKSKSSSNVGHLVSKKIWKSRSKSQTRTSSPIKSLWMPQGNCVWMSSLGRCVHLTENNLQNLTEVERKILHHVAVEKIQQLNFGISVTVPSDSIDSQPIVQQKPQKRRALLLKRKALTTGFFDTNKTKTDDVATKPNSSGGLVFGLSLEQCLDNDNRLNKQSASGRTSSGGSQQSVNNNNYNNPAAGSRSSRNSFSSLLDNSRDAITTGSCESLPSRTSHTGLIEDNTGNHGYLNSSILTSSLSQCDIRRGSNDDDEILPPPLFGLQKINDQHVPALVIACIDHLEQYGLNTVGIFRVSTSKKRVRQLREDFDRGIMTQLETDICPHDVATLLKEFLRDLPEPLLCRNLYQAFVNTQKIRNRRLQLEGIAHLVQLLPVAHRDTLYKLLQFLAKVARHSDDVIKNDGSVITIGNKMDSNNLATVFAPNILHCVKPGKGTTEQEIDERIDVINVIRIMIDHYEELFRIPAELMDEIYTNMMDLFPQQLDYLCDRRDMFSKQEETDTGSISPISPPPITESTDCNNTMPLLTSIAQQQLQNEFLESQQMRRIYAREEFLHENAIKTDTSNGIMRRRDRSSKMRYQENESDMTRRRRRDRSGYDPSNINDHSDCVSGNSSANSNLITGGNLTKLRSASIDSNAGVTTSCGQVGNIDDGARRMSSPFVLKNTGVLTASLKIPVQMQTPLNIGDDIPDIPYIEDASYGHDDARLPANMVDGHTGGSQRHGLGHILMSSRDRFQRKSLASHTGITTGTLSLRQSQDYHGSITSPTMSTTTTASGSTSTSTSPDQLQNQHQRQLFFGDDDYLSKLISVQSQQNQQQQQQQQPTTIKSQSTSSGNDDVVGVQKSSSLYSVMNKKHFEAKKIPSKKLSIASPSIMLSSNKLSMPIKDQPLNNEPKITTSITNIGGAVMRSKTADFERRLLQTKKYKSNNNESSQLQQQSMDSDNNEKTNNSGDANGNNNCDRRQGPIYKRQEIISSVQSSKK